MNRIYTIVIGMLIYASLAGQTLYLSNDTVSMTGYSDEVEIVAHALIYNNTPDSIDVDWIRFVEQIPSDWSGTAVCDANGCYLIPVSEPDTFCAIAPNSNSIFDVHFYPNNYTGNGTVQLRAWVVGDSANTAIVGTFKATAEDVVGVGAPQEREKIRIYPNPAKDYILIKNLPEREVSTVEVYNIFGRRMLSFSQAANNIDTVQKFDINTLTKGIYMIRVFDAGMNVIYTESLSKE